VTNNIARRRNDRTWSESTIRLNPTSTFHTTTCSHERAVVRPRGGHDTSPLAHLLHGIISIVLPTESKQKSNCKERRQSIDRLLQGLLLLTKKSALPLRKPRGIIRDSNFDQRLSRILANHVELAVKGILLLPLRSEVFAPVLILVVPRSTFDGAPSHGAIECPALRERVQSQSTYSESLPICVPWTSPSVRHHIITRVLDKFRCSLPVDSLHKYNQCYSPRTIGQHVPATNKIDRAEVQLTSYPIRSRTKISGGHHRRPATSATVKPGRSSSYANTGGKNGKQPFLPGKKSKEELSDEDEKDGERPRKRPRQSKDEVTKLRLPCIFQVHDQRAHTRDARWRFCNSQYPDPSALS
jgi:hypothetical protein